MKSKSSYVLFLFVGLLGWIPQLHATLLIYDTEMTYVNPFVEVPQGCRPCVDFYRVVRPLAPLVNHVVIGATATLQCGWGFKKQNFIYGASKGAEDLSHFNSALEFPSNDLQPLGRACDEQARVALQTATQISQRWQVEIKDQFSFIEQMLMTPLWGRICNNAAEEIKLAIGSKLTRAK